MSPGGYHGTLLGPGVRCVHQSMYSGCGVYPGVYRVYIQVGIPRVYIGCIYPGIPPWYTYPGIPPGTPTRVSFLVHLPGYPSWYTYLGIPPWYTPPGIHASLLPSHPGIHASLLPSHPGEAGSGRRRTGEKEGITVRIVEIMGLYPRVLHIYQLLVRNTPERS